MAKTDENTTAPNGQGDSQSDTALENKPETSNTEGENLTKSMKARIAKMQSKHKQDVELAKLQAIEEFKQAQGIDDKTLETGQINGLYRRLVDAESQLNEYRQRDQQIAMNKTLEELELTFVGDTARDIFVKQLEERVTWNPETSELSLNDPEENETVNDFIKKQADEMDFLLAPIARPGGGATGSIGGLPPTVSRPAQHELGGPVLSDGDKRQAWKQFLLQNSKG